MLYQRFTPREGANHERTRARLREIAAAHPETRVAWAARYGIGSLYAAEEIWASCEGEWAALLRNLPSEEPFRAALARELAEVRYALAKRYESQGDLKQATRYLDLAVGQLEARKREEALALLPEWSVSFGDYENARRYFLEGARLAPNRDIELWRRYRAASCLVSLGRLAEAVPEYQDILAQPDVSDMVAEECRRELALCQAKSPAERLQLLERDLDKEAP